MILNEKGNKMKNIFKFCSFLVFYYLLNLQTLYCQTFQSNVLIDILGNNYDLNILSPYSINYVIDTHITWINELDSVYTVYLKQISPEMGNNIVISSGNSVKSNPQVISSISPPGVKIVWQNFINNYWQILSRNYTDGSLGEIITIKDSLPNDLQISASTHRITWIKNGDLYVSLFPEPNQEFIIDSSGCSSPDILKNDNYLWTEILYVKEDEGNYEIYLAQYEYMPIPVWYKILISSSGNNANPRFGLMGNISYQTYENEVWKIRYSKYWNEFFITTNNESCNYLNPFVFTYDVPTISRNEDTPFFLAFDSDSLENNNEVFIKTFYFEDETDDSLINISNMEGDDYEPSAAYIRINDTVYAAVFWLHTENEKTDIWMAKTLFNPIYTDIKDETELNSFYLLQNYPNPFNPSTTIEYFLPEAEFITLKIYDIIGNEITTLINEFHQSGKYKVDFNANSYSSGIYIVQMNAGRFIRTLKITFIK
jgi:hypothetical protein